MNFGGYFFMRVILYLQEYLFTIHCIENKVYYTDLRESDKNVIPIAHILLQAVEQRVSYAAEINNLREHIRRYGVHTIHLEPRKV